MVGNRHHCGERRGGRPASPRRRFTILQTSTPVVEVCVFFFQAEDGIRDRNVTGVQTCALPISPFGLPIRIRLPRFLAGEAAIEEWQESETSLGIRVTISNRLFGAFFGYEGAFERDRKSVVVGKECRSRWRARHGYRDGKVILGM